MDVHQDCLVALCTYYLNIITDPLHSVQERKMHRVLQSKGPGLSQLTKYLTVGLDNDK
ncbi:hypothetical protein PAXRUDRAFT_830820 [Paxillus rubicundulus Ve08.2h10]|uniref:Uncharacterized protein n=1 Tax=Paxillus rubicundulus Ve08.2h10 TaxID=930991 RepID=A0A0D0DK26_9AGAM|nr:hypothetical protein PAXRUDRAFT_830820 [Paxillus rubicundulus Ve08.2h10]